ncbi:MAG: NUDIX domain-containing protein [Gordonia sp. (in: high G+C Gram-positive bacteria)]|uniref:(deoxy)nucleoside triphosphate pyrophosphohydrolase n=1 Tax=Gordonia sp. (in: high G+C Gram-positive bacteria) TaxID=84139 RepID=UPI0039E31491
MTAPRVVVAGAVIRADGPGARILLAQRAYPPELAGLWELPGGKVEPGETDERALERELREELGIAVTIGAAVGADVPLPGGLVLRAYAARWESGEPAALEHRAVAWFDEAHLARAAAAGEIVSADTGWVPDLVELLRRRAPS